jgi:S1-C subfamily serine protease
MSGLPVSPAADNPSRAGILVVAVNGGSVAERAGLITGDIIDEIDARPTHSLADLEAAIEASAGHATATIKIFRGLKEMTLKARF